MTVYIKHDLLSLAESLAMITQDFRNGDMSAGEFIAQLDEISYHVNRTATAAEINEKHDFIVRQAWRQHLKQTDAALDELERSEARDICQS